MMKDDDTTWTVETDRGVSLCSRKLRVEFFRGPLEGKVFELPGPEIRMGSGRDCDVVIPDRTVSHQHAVLRVEKSGVRVIDSKSRNGTLVDNVRIRDAYARPDASISMGGSVMRLQMIRDVVELPLSTRDHFGALIGRSIAMRKVYALLERVAIADTTVLIEGETGTGKELVAAAIHEASPRAQQPFVVFDCSAVPSELIESELFGHVRGAYTNALGDRKGRFREANGGTLFLDEIGELPIELQPKLLRALEARTIRPLGADKEHVVDVRVLAATNRNLAIEVDRGRFREDLYYRIAVVPVRLPPLRERIDDIPLLVRRFEHDWRSRPNRPAPIPDTVIERMKQLPWPGNVRELRNKVDMMLSLGLASLPGARQYESSRAGGAFDVDLDTPFHSWCERLVESHTKAYFAAALEKTKGNVSQTAALAGVSRAFLQKIMKRLDLRNAGEG
ncbi:MAG: sigma 54-interacting transcriptional regulator [Polyangiaceae bacterium]|nr:sigma 54-interacting transcriptional regulator [Polyangiaceae bacterium]